MVESDVKGQLKLTQQVFMGVDTKVCTIYSLWSVQPRSHAPPPAQWTVPPVFVQSHALFWWRPSHQEARFSVLWHGEKKKAAFYLDSCLLAAEYHGAGQSVRGAALSGRPPAGRRPTANFLPALHSLEILT